LLPHIKTNTRSNKHSISSSGRLWYYMAGCTGKRGRAVELSTSSTTRLNDIGHFEKTNTLSVTTSSEINVVNLFSIGASKMDKEIKEVKPFIHQVKFHGPQGEVIRVWANVDDGAMKEVMSSAMFKKVKHRLGPTLPSSQLLRVANGDIVQSEAKWEGKIEVNGISTRVTFEVFDSGGKWDFLLGKTLLEKFKAIHNYEADGIEIHGAGGKSTLHNQSHIPAQQQNKPKDPPPISIISESEDNQPSENEELAEVDTSALRKDTNLVFDTGNPWV
jgi:hypothetical protein